MANNLIVCPYWPRLLSRTEAATYAGVSPSLFDNLIAEEVYPKSKTIPGHRRVVWDRHELDIAIDELPNNKDNPWDANEAA